MKRLIFTIKWTFAAFAGLGIIVMVPAGMTWVASHILGEHYAFIGTVMFFVILVVSMIWTSYDELEEDYIKSSQKGNK